jgi:hypothetical protein
LINLEGNDMSEQDKAILDAVTFGTGVMQGGQHVPYKDTLPETITIPIAEYEAMRLDAERYRYVRTTPRVGFEEWENIPLNPDEIDAAIDLAIKEGN